MTDLREQLGCHLSNSIVSNGWEGSLRAAKGMGCSELCPTGTVTGESSGLPSITDTQCIPESLLVEGAHMFLNWKSRQPCRCSLF